MIYVMFGLLVFIAVLLIAVLTIVANIEKDQPKTIKVIRRSNAVGETIDKFNSLGYEVVEVKRVDNTYSIEFVKVR